MSTLPEQFSAARKAQVEFQMEFARKFSAKFVESTQRVIALNLDTGRASMERSAAALRQLLEVRDPRDLLALTTQTQANVDSLLAYSRELLHIASGAQGELLQTVTRTALPAAPFALAAPFLAAPLAAAPFVADDAPTDAELEHITDLVTAPVEAGQHFASAAAEAVRHSVAAASAAVQDNVASFQQEVEVEVELAADAAKDIAEPAIELAEAQLTPIAEAISEAVAEAEPATLAAAPFVVDNHVEITGMTPVDAAPPAVSSTPFVEKQELTQGKSRKKK